MLSKEAAFTAKLLATFRLEAEEHLKNLNEGLLILEKATPSVDQAELLEKIFREAHSLKGAARAVNFTAVQSICQGMESVFAILRKHPSTPSSEQFNVLYRSLDYITKLLTQVQGTPESSREFTQILSDLEKFLKCQPGSTPEAANPAKTIARDIAPEVEINQLQSPEIVAVSSADVTAQLPTENDNIHVFPSAMSPTNQQAVPSSLTGKTVRVSLSQLDQLFQQAEELLTIKLTAQQQLHELKQMQGLLQQWNKEAQRLENDLCHPLSEKQGGAHNDTLKVYIGRHHHFLSSFKEALSRVLKTTSQDQRLLSGLIDSLLEDNKKLLMQPFGTAIESFPRMIRDLSQQLGKEVHIQFSGSDIEIDRRILEEMKDPLIHLVRNSLDHGIEAPHERQKKNKPAIGNIHITVAQLSSNSVEIVVADDGQGIDLQRLRQTAVLQKILSSKEADALTDQEAIRLIFHSGISTSRIVSELSGRGLGMSIVLEKVDKLGGQLTVHSDATGTSVHIILPLTLATFRGIQLKVADQLFIMPTHNVMRVLRVKREALKTVENRSVISVDGTALAYAHLKDLLGIKANIEENIEKNAWLTILIVKATEQKVALGVDGVLNERDVLVKRFGKPLLRVKNILSATVMEMGKVVTILNPSDLVKTMSGQISYSINPTATEKYNEMAVKRILLAEDSVTTRMLLKNILEAAGYDVTLAVDGLEALSKLKEETIDLLLSDIEMPNMNGFTLVEKVRNDGQLKDLPVVLCTSLAKPEDRARGIEVGANAYLEKSSFTQSHLLDVIERLL